MHETEDIILQIEALIFASDQPLSIINIVDYLNEIRDDIVNEQSQIAQAIEKIQNKYSDNQFPFELVQSGGGYQFMTKKQYHQLIATLNGEKYNKKLSTTAMETLSIIAYKQPVTKSDIEYIRGVSADYALQKLLDKELIAIIGRDEEAIGKPLLYATTKHLLDFLGINSKDELPRLNELNTKVILPTNAENAMPDDIQHAQVGTMSVNESGHLEM